MTTLEVVTRTHRWYTVLPLTAILVYLLTLTGYWQLIFAGGLLAGILSKRPRTSFLVATVAGAVGWGVPLTIASLYYPLGKATALLVEILGLSSSLSLVPFILTLLISAVVTGLGALLGAYAYGAIAKVPETVESA